MNHQNVKKFRKYIFKEEKKELKRALSDLLKQNMMIIYLLIINAMLIAGIFIRLVID